VDSGSCVLRQRGGVCPSNPGFPKFPINATSIHRLYSKGRIKLPPLTRDNIWDTSKADRLAKWVAFLQAGWIIIQVISRAVQRLAITPLELFTSAFIVPSLATAYFWANKPQNVGEPTVIDVDWSIADLLVSAGDCAKEPYVDTPMDFIEKPPWDGWRRLPSLLHFGGLEKRPLERIPNDYSPPPPTGTEAMIVWVVSVIHATIHVIGWSFPFPTPIESIIWRASSLTLLFILAIGGLVPVLSTQPWFDFTFTLLWIWVRHAKKNTLMRRWCFKVVADISYAAYIVARLLLFAEIFAAFRALPADAYKDVEWSQFWPHGQ